MIKIILLMKKIIDKGINNDKKNIIDEKIIIDKKIID